jgi:hypothetical protein
MNKKLILSSLLTLATVGITSGVWAHPAYVKPANAVGSCGDCHVGGTRSKTFVPGLIAQFPIDQTLPIADKIKAIFRLTDAQRLPVWKAWDKKINPKPTTPDTKPVLKIGTARYTVKIGGPALVIPLTVTDKENDTYSIDGPDLTASKPTAFNGNVSTFNYIWKVTEPEYAGETFPIEITVKEDQRKKGRNLMSNTVKAFIKVVR